MDLYVERQCVDQMKIGQMKQFTLLFDAYFPHLYRYVARRLKPGQVTEEIVRLTFLDALGQIQNTPTDIGYVVWLYSLAKPRVWEKLGKEAFEGAQGAHPAPDENGENLAAKSEKMFSKLLLEEREILRLKFFEEVADGDVMTVLGIQDGLIGPKIYRVLKRAHFLLFGESDERQGVYFGELSGFLARIREAEEVEIPEAFKLSLRADIENRIDRKDFAIDVEPFEESKTAPPFEAKDEDIPTGSNDPAKIFVQAVKEMREEEDAEKFKSRLKVEKQEKVFDFIDRWKIVLMLVPALIFASVVALLVVTFVDFDGKVVRGYPTLCSQEVVYKGTFSDGERRKLDREVADRLCIDLVAEEVEVTQIAEEVVEVDLVAEGFQLHYKFVKKEGEWRITEYEKTPDSDKKSGKIPRDRGSTGRSAL
ncbi:MAG: hypothetical protein O3B47_01245 [bacterium]|nr:hypothetical protein [bacterium]